MKFEYKLIAVISFLSILIVGIIINFPAQWKPDFNIVEDKQIAYNFTISSPTFKFDGIKNTYFVDSMGPDKKNPSIHKILVSFDSSHTGYGDRSDQDIENTTTRHFVTIMIENDKIISAIMDDIWDELNQNTVTKNKPRTNTPEFILDFSHQKGDDTDTLYGVIFDSSKKTLTITTGLNQQTLGPLKDEIFAELWDTVGKTNIFSADDDYPPLKGSVDYITYSLSIQSGELLNEVSWTDSSPNTPTSAIIIQEKVNSIIKNIQNNPNLEYNNDGLTQTMPPSYVKIVDGLQIVTIDAKEFKFIPSELHIKAGKTKFILVNVGETTHELVVYESSKKDIVDKAELAEDEKTIGKNVLFEINDLAPGKSGESDILNLKEGSYVMGCHVPGHYEAGMKGTIDIQP